MGRRWGYAAERASVVCAHRWWRRKPRTAMRAPRCVTSNASSDVSSHAVKTALRVSSSSMRHAPCRGTHVISEQRRAKVRLASASSAHIRRCQRMLRATPASSRTPSATRSTARSTAASPLASSFAWIQRTRTLRASTPRMVVNQPAPCGVTEARRRGHTSCGTKQISPTRGIAKLGTRCRGCPGDHRVHGVMQGKRGRKGEVNAM